jgi:hypothetical protein
LTSLGIGSIGYSADAPLKVEEPKTKIVERKELTPEERKARRVKQRAMWAKRREARTVKIKALETKVGAFATGLGVLKTNYKFADEETNKKYQADIGELVNQYKEIEGLRKELYSPPTRNRRMRRTRRTQREGLIKSEKKTHRVPTKYNTRP